MRSIKKICRSIKKYKKLHVCPRASSNELIPTRLWFMKVWMHWVGLSIYIQWTLSQTPVLTCWQVTRVVDCWHGMHVDTLTYSRLSDKHADGICRFWYFFFIRCKQLHNVIPLGEGIPNLCIIDKSWDLIAHFKVMESGQHVYNNVIKWYVI